MKIKLHHKAMIGSNFEICDKHPSIKDVTKQAYIYIYINCNVHRIKALNEVNDGVRRQVRAEDICVYYRALHCDCVTTWELLQTDKLLFGVKMAFTF